MTGAEEIHRTKPYIRERLLQVIDDVVARDV
jgi:hypothetical protein